MPRAFRRRPFVVPPAGGICTECRAQFRLKAGRQTLHRYHWTRLCRGNQEAKSSGHQMSIFRNWALCDSRTVYCSPEHCGLPQKFRM